MTDYIGLGIIQYHAGLMQHTLDDIKGVLGRGKGFLGRQNFTVCINDLHIVPLVDIHFLHIIAVKILGQKRKTGHLSIKKLRQFIRFRPVHTDPLFLQIFSNVAVNQSAALVGIVL